MKKVVYFLVAVFLLATLTFCGKEKGEGQETEAEPGSPDRSDDLYVVVSMFTGIDYHIEYIRALEIIEEELGVRTEFVGPADYNINEMIAAIEQAITKQADGLIIMGWEETLEPVIGKAMDEGIPVITVTADLPASDRLSFIGIDNFDVGKKSAEFLAEQLNYEGKVAILRAVGLPNVQQRFEGFSEVIESYPDMELVADLDHKNDSATAAQLVTGILLKHPDMGGIYAADGLSGPGVVAGLKDADMVGKVKVIASDREDAVLASIADGFIDATIIAQTSLEPYLAIKLIDSMKYSGLELSMDDEAVGITLIPPRVHSGSFIVDRDNVKYFRRDYKK
jgi:ribose transport system substrate-binding protein